MTLHVAIEHITILTGSARISRRSEVSDDIVDHIRAAIAAGGDLWDTGWRVRLHQAPEGCWVYELESAGEPVVTCVLCADPERSAEMWEAASRIGTLPGTVLHPPTQIPWLAAAIAPSAALLSDTHRLVSLMREAGDLERCVAWALLE
ncbi:hypothetical protein [Methylocystis sp. S23]